jgi:hypothetical protein
MRQMYRTGIAQFYIVALANMTGRAQANGGHPGSNGRLDPTRAVFDDEALIRAYASLPAANRKMSGCGFPRATISALKT